MTNNTLELSRFQPDFCSPGKSGLPLGYGGISREPVKFILKDKNGIEILAPNSRMAVEIDSAEINGMHYINNEHIKNGVLIGLGRAILLCMHWISVLPKDNSVTGFVGVSSAAQIARDLIKQIARSDTTVLILGETGTGKEVAAQAIHSLGARAHQRMLSVNMAALNESLAAADLFGAVKGSYTGAHTARKGYFQEAEGSTLFMDEIGNAPSTVQPMLLRVLETRDYCPLGSTKELQSSARIIAATDQNIYDGTFNPALLRRLEGYLIQLPALRERREDIGVLILHILSSPTFSEVADVNITYTFIKEFATYDWPGNIRQLGNYLKRALLCEKMGTPFSLASLTDSDIKPRVKSVSSHTQNTKRNSRKNLKRINADDVLQAMEKNKWNIQEAANALGVSRPSMYKLLEENPEVSRIEKISAANILAAWHASEKNIDRCASLLKTPAEALRRHLRGLGY